MAKRHGQHDTVAVSVKEAARILGVCEQTVRKAARLGRIPSLRILKRVVIPRSGLDRLLGADQRAPSDR